MSVPWRIRYVIRRKRFGSFDLSSILADHVACARVRRTSTIFFFHNTPFFSNFLYCTYRLCVFVYLLFDRFFPSPSLFFLFPAPPEITPFYFSELTEGSRVQVACTVHQGDLPLNLTWLKDGDLVHRGSGGAVVTPFNAYSTILTVNNVSRSDTGDYTCVAANPVHSATFTAHLTVNGTLTEPPGSSGPRDVVRRSVGKSSGSVGTVRSGGGGGGGRVEPPETNLFQRKRHNRKYARSFTTVTI